MPSHYVKSCQLFKTCLGQPQPEENWTFSFYWKKMECRTWSAVWASQFSTIALMILMCSQRSMWTIVQKCTNYPLLVSFPLIAFCCKMSVFLYIFFCFLLEEKDPPPLKDEPLHQIFASLSLLPATRGVSPPPALFPVFSVLLDWLLPSSAWIFKGFWE